MWLLSRYCGGCGFAHRAKELQEYLDASVGIRPALLRDNGATGNFDVSVRARPEGGAAKEDETVRCDGVLWVLLLVLWVVLWVLWVLLVLWVLWVLWVL